MLWNNEENKGLFSELQEMLGGEDYRALSIAWLNEKKDGVKFLRGVMMIFHCWELFLYKITNTKIANLLKIICCFSFLHSQEKQDLLLLRIQRSHKYGQSIFFFSNALDLIQAEPVIGFSDFLDGNDYFVFLLDHFGLRGSQHALGVGYSKDPIFSFVALNSNFEGSF